MTFHRKHWPQRDYAPPIRRDQFSRVTRRRIRRERDGHPLTGLFWAVIITAAFGLALYGFCHFLAWEATKRGI